MSAAPHVAPHTMDVKLKLDKCAVMSCTSCVQQRQGLYPLPSACLLMMEPISRKRTPGFTAEMACIMH